MILKPFAAKEMLLLFRKKRLLNHPLPKCAAHFFLILLYACVGRKMWEDICKT